MNVSNFFRDLRTKWQRENRTRSEVKFVRRVVHQYVDVPLEGKMVLLDRQMDNYEGIIAGREPEVWADKPSLS